MITIHKHHTNICQMVSSIHPTFKIRKPMDDIIQNEILEEVREVTDPMIEDLKQYISEV